MRRQFVYMVVAAFVVTAIFLPITASVASTRQEIKKFGKFIRILDDNYINDLDYQYLIEVAIRSVLNETDPYSIYINSGDFDDLTTMIESPSIDTMYMVNDTTACIKVAIFSQHAASDILQSYQSLNEPENLILDLRGNKGGLVTEAIATSNLFLESGVPLFKRKRRGRSTITYKTHYDGELLATKLIVVIDGESASASEIVATALQSSGRALIVGERSYGKAMIITPFTLPDRSVVMVATSQYTTPAGGAIQRSYRGRMSSNDDGGIVPDLQFSGDEIIYNKDFLMFIISLKEI